VISIQITVNNWIKNEGFFFVDFSKCRRSLTITVSHFVVDAAFHHCFLSSVVDVSLSSAVAMLSSISFSLSCSYTLLFSSIREHTFLLYGELIFWKLLTVLHEEHCNQFVCSETRFRMRFRIESSACVTIYLLKPVTNHNYKMVTSFFWFGLRGSSLVFTESGLGFWKRNSLVYGSVRDIRFFWTPLTGGTFITYCSTLRILPMHVLLGDALLFYIGSSSNVLKTLRCGTYFVHILVWRWHLAWVSEVFSHHEKVRFLPLD